MNKEHKDTYKNYPEQKEQPPLGWETQALIDAEDKIPDLEGTLKVLEEIENMGL